jgi:anti-sigma B factor antagonist
MAAVRGSPGAQATLCGSFTPAVEGLHLGRSLNEFNPPSSGSRGTQEVEMRYVKVKRLNGVVVVQPSRNLVGDKETAELQEALLQMITGGVQCLIVDLSEVGFMNTNGLEVLVFAKLKSLKSEVQMKLCNLNERTKAIIAILKLVQWFDIHESEEEAIASCG